MGKTYKPQQRNPYVKKAYSDEIDLRTKAVPSKTQYKRKPKYKNGDYSVEFYRTWVRKLHKNQLRRTVKTIKNAITKKEKRWFT